MGVGAAVETREDKTAARAAYKIDFARIVNLHHGLMIVSHADDFHSVSTGDFIYTHRGRDRHGNPAGTVSLKVQFGYDGQ